MSSRFILLTIVVQSVLGTFPPVINPPPIPGQTVTSLDTAPQIYIQDDFNEGFPLPSVRDGPLPLDNFDDQRWIIQERSSEESSENPNSMETFDRFYPNGELAIGPVATPKPDENYVAQPSSISKMNPRDGMISGTSDLWILSRATDNNQYVSNRWIQVPSERVVEVVNRDSAAPLATDAVKSVSAPLPDPQSKSQISQVWPGSTLQQILNKIFTAAPPQKIISNQPVAIQLPSRKQLVDIQSPKQVVQQQVTKDSYPFSPPAILNAVSSQFPVKKPFVVPPPPPPPVKGGDKVNPKVFQSAPVNPAPGSNVFITDTNGLLQQLRHIWVPTSSRTGRFVTIPFSSTNSGKSIINKGTPVNQAPVSISDTWVLRTDGLIPSFEQQKSIAPPPVAQPGNVIYRDPSVFQVDSPPVSQVISTIDYPKNPQTVRNVNLPLNIWPLRNYFTNSRLAGKTVLANAPALSVPTLQSGAVVAGKSAISAGTPVAAQKTIVGNQKLYPTPIPQLNSQLYRIVNGKPCPVTPQKSTFSSDNPILLQPPVSKVIATQNKVQPTRIIRINQFPTGSYYLLNSRATPNIVTYPNPQLTSQSKSGVVRIIQAKQPAVQVPTAVQTKQPVFPLQRQVVIPVQQVIAPQIPSKIAAYSLPLRQTFAQLPLQKSLGGFFSPNLQPLRYPYPLNGYLGPVSVPAKGPLVPQSIPLKAKPLKNEKSNSSSSESSSESSSSEGSSKEEKEKAKKEEIKNEENDKSGEKENEAEKIVYPNSELEKEESKETEVISEESNEADESTKDASAISEEA